jgi:hypothetical protein
MKIVAMLEEDTKKKRRSYCNSNEIMPNAPPPILSHFHLRFYKKCTICNSVQISSLFPCKNMSFARVKQVHHDVYTRSPAKSSQ